MQLTEINANNVLCERKLIAYKFLIIAEVLSLLHVEKNFSPYYFFISSIKSSIKTSKNLVIKLTTVTTVLYTKLSFY